MLECWIMSYCHSFLNLCLCFSRLQTKQILIWSERVSLLVNSLYAKAIGLVKLWAALSASSPELI
jgi:hypothetical protein